MADSATTLTDEEEWVEWRAPEGWVDLTTGERVWVRECDELLAEHMPDGSVRFRAYRSRTLN